MNHQRRHRVWGLRETVGIAAAICVGLIALAFLWMLIIARPGAQNLGVTFSSRYAEDLGLNAEDVLTELITDVGVRNIRLPVYWSEIERTQGNWNFEKLDRLMAIAEKYDARITLAIGMKVPRWPECFAPEYLNTASDSVLDAAVYRYVQALTDHAKHYPALVRWQVENEPLFPYGDCPSPSLNRLRHEVELVRSLDTQHPVMLTVSGEQEPWLDLASLADTIGVSMYRFAYNDSLGPVTFPHRPMYYRMHAMYTSLFAQDVIISELQMEPWFTGSPQVDGSIAIPFSETDFTEHLNFAKQTGIREVLLWGAEWWYYQKMHGDDSLWNAARRAFSESE